MVVLRLEWTDFNPVTLHDIIIASSDGSYSCQTAPLKDEIILERKGMLYEVLLPTSTADLTVVQPADTPVSIRVPKVGANMYDIIFR